MADEEVKGLAVKIAMESGSFKQGMQMLKSDLAVIDSGFKASVAGVKNWGTTLDGLKGNATALGEKIKVQEKIVEQYTSKLKEQQTALDANAQKMTDIKSRLDATESAYVNAAKRTGENSAESKKLKTELDALQKEYAKSEGVVRKNQASVQGYTIQVNNAKKGLGEMKGELARTTEQIDKYDRGVKNAALSTDKLNKELDQKVNKAIKGMAAGLAAAAIGIFKLAEASSDLSEAQNVVGETFRTAKKEITEWASTLALSAGIGETAATNMVGSMGAMLKSSGFMETAAIDISKGLVQLSGDMASFYNLDNETAWEKIRAGMVGTVEPLRQLGINMSVTNLSAFALAEGMEKPFAKMTEKEKILVRYQYLMKVTADAQGDFARTSDGMANQMRITKLQLEDTKVKLGQLVQPYVTEFLKSFNTGLKDLDFKKVSDAIGFVVDNAGAFKVAGATIVGILVLWKASLLAVTIAQQINNATMTITALKTGGVAAASEFLTAAEGKKSAALAISGAALIGHNIKLGATTVAQNAYSAATGTATAATTAFNAALWANPIGIALLAGLLIAGGAILALAKNYRELKKEIRETYQEALRLNQEAYDNRMDTIYEEREEKRAIKIEEEGELNKAHELAIERIQEESEKERKAGAEKLQALRKNLQERQRALDAAHSAAIKAIQEEYGVFEQRNKSRTEKVQEELNARKSGISDILTLAKNAASLEGKAYQENAQKILATARAVHNEKIAMYAQEYLYSLGIIDEELAQKINAYQAEIDELEAKTAAEEELEKERANKQKLADLRDKVSKARTNAEYLSAQKALEDEITRQKREALLRQRKDRVSSLNEQIKDATAKANEEKAKLFKVLQERVAAEETLLVKKADNTIAQIQRERRAKEDAENKKYAAAKSALDREQEALDKWIGGGYADAQQKKLKTALAAEKTRHEKVIENLKAEIRQIEANSRREAQLAEYTLKKKNAMAELERLRIERAQVLAQQALNPKSKALQKQIDDLGARMFVQEKIIEGADSMLNRGFAKGTTNYPGGISRINEEGGEILVGPKGMTIIPHDVSMEIARSVGAAVSSANAGSGITINIINRGTVVGTGGMDELANAMSRKIAGNMKLSVGGR